MTFTNDLGRIYTNNTFPVIPVEGKLEDAISQFEPAMPVPSYVSPLLSSSDYEFTFVSVKDIFRIAIYGQNFRFNMKIFEGA